MRSLKLKDWAEFREFVMGYASQSRGRRELLSFRGHGEAKWPLQATLDRERKFSSDKERNDYYSLLLAEFRREALFVLTRPGELPDGDAFDLVARHHGIPSPFLDWTRSPYIAAFFAFQDVRGPAKGSVAIWIIDQGLFTPDEADFTVVDDPNLLRFNRRALQQRGLFTRIKTIQRSVEQIMNTALTKLTISNRCRSIAMTDLDAMSINSTTLFSDLDGAARTSRFRCAQATEGPDVGGL